MELVEATREFVRIEEKYDLDSIEINGVAVWRYLRPGLAVATQSAVDGSANSNSVETTGFSKKKVLKSILTNTISRPPLVNKNVDILYYGFPRRMRLQDGYFWDKYFEHFNQETEYRHSWLEDPHVYRSNLELAEFHDKPPKTNWLSYTDPVHFLPRLMRYSGITDRLPIPRFSLPQKLVAAIGEFEDTFGVSIDTQQRVKRTLHRHAIEKPFYKWVIDRSNPDILLLVQRIGKEPLLEVCDQENVPVVEFQQGAITNAAVAGRHPIQSNPKNFPDFFFTFGDYWTDRLQLPISDDRVISVGWPFLEEVSKKSNSQPGRRNSILFLSQPAVGNKLANLAYDLSRVVDSEFEIVFRPHPGRRDAVSKFYPQLINSEVVLNTDTSLYEQFRSSCIQVGVGSTALFEGLRFGLETFLVGGFAEEYTVGLSELGLATHVNSVNELVTLIEKSSGVTRDKTVDYVFEPGSIRNIQREIDTILSEWD
jgi:hypothetical protein